MLANEQVLTDAINATAGVPGDIAEIGVYTGDSARHMAELTDCRLYLYDTFAGCPGEMVTPRDNIHGHGSLAAPRRVAEATLAQHRDRCTFRQGVFPKTATEDPGPFRLVHVDCDLFLSTLAALAWASTRLSADGLIVCDDYGCGSTKGAKEACDMFLAIVPGWELKVVGHGQAVIKRRQTNDDH